MFVIWACMGLGVRALWKKPKNHPNGRLDYGDVAGLVHAAVAGFIAYRLTHSGLDLSVIPLAITLGYGMHLFGDLLTEYGIPWNWPNRKRYRLASINTGEWVEKWVVGSVLYAGIAAVVFVTHSTWWPALLRTVAPG
jgi:membrane-bound metal-dependent hydrolase YbcI (DUF457 family)